MKTQHLGWLSCSLLRGRIIYLKLLVASRTRRVYKWFYKIFSIETERQVNPCHRVQLPLEEGGNRALRQAPSGCWKHAWCFQALALFNTFLALTDP